MLLKKINPWLNFTNFHFENIEAEKSIAAKSDDFKILGVGNDDIYVKVQLSSENW